VSIYYAALVIGNGNGSDGETDGTFVMDDDDVNSCSTHRAYYFNVLYHHHATQIIHQSYNKKVKS
jgi:hypothetical protein